MQPNEGTTNVIRSRIDGTAFAFRGRQLAFNHFCRAQPPSRYFVQVDPMDGAYGKSQAFAIRRTPTTIHKKLKHTGRAGLRAIRAISKKFKGIERNYRFFAKTKERKDKIVNTAVALCGRVLAEISSVVPGTKAFEALLPHVQDDVLKLTGLGPRLLEQILYWLKTGKVARDKIISLWKMIPTAIKKGKIGKPVEFGRKWIINCYRGGYVLVSAPDNPKLSDQHAVEESLSLHSTVFDTMPTSYGTDRGMWGKPNLELCLSAGIKKIAIQPKGRAHALVSQRDLLKMSHRRIGIEARIAHLKTRGLGTSRMKTDIGDLISGHRSALARNLTLLMRDLVIQPGVATA